VVCLGIYSFFEDKWYDLLEWVNNFVPVLSVTDQVDRIIPSFILFLLFLLLLILGAGAFLFLNTTPTYDVEVLVLNKVGTPIEGASVELSMGCSEEGIQLLTNAEGKVAFTACDTAVDVYVAKQSYKASSITLDFSDEKSQTISLSPLEVPTREVNVTVVDSLQNLIQTAGLELTCIKGNDSNKQIVKTTNPLNTQGTQGFKTVVPSGCTLVQLKATAQLFNEKTVTLNSTENTKKIVLEKPVTLGTAIFTANSPMGLQSDAIITVTDSDDKEYTLYTLANGQVTKEFNEGSYSYSAVSNGAQASGAFSIIANKPKDVNVYFSSIVPIVDTTKMIYLSLKDGNTGVGGAEAKIFFTKGNDTNYWMPLSSTLAGIIGPSPVTDTNNKTFTAIIKANNYETKLVPIELRTRTDSPQLVAMKQGGTTLKVKVINDINVPVSNVQTVLYLSTFDGYFDKAALTDVNGVTQYKGLPSGTYKITAKTDTDEGEQSGIYVSGTTKEIVLRMITGRSTIKFNLVDDEGKTNALVQFYVQNSSGNFVKTYEGRTTRFFYDSNTLKAEQKVKLAVIDENYIPTESFVYKLKRGSQEKTVYLRKQTSLPNQKETQMMLRQVYVNNPLTLNETTASRIMPGEKYYLLFDLVLNKEEDKNVLANFYVGPQEIPILLAHNPFTLGYTASKEGYVSVLSSKLEGFEINPSKDTNPYLISTGDSNAKQLNVRLGMQTGLQMIPIIVEVSVDINATGKTKIFWQSRFGDTNTQTTMSLPYSKEFEIGKSFCMGLNCPAFLFSNYLKHADDNPIPLSETTQVLLLGESYKLQTIVENLTDEAIGDANLTMTVEQSGQNRLLFAGDKNVTSAQVALNPLAQTNLKEFDLTTKASAYGAIKVFEKLQKMQGSVNELASTEGNTNNFVRFEVRNRNDLNIIIVATQTNNVIYEKAFYPFFVIKVLSVDGMTKAKKGTRADWYATIEGATSSIYNGKTDENGYATLAFDATNITAGTKIIFTAVDVNNSTPARLEVITTKAFPDPVPDPIECVKIKIGGVIVDSNYLATHPFPAVKLDVNVIDARNNSLSVYYPEDLACEGVRRIALTTEIQATPKSFDINKGQTITIALDGTPTVQAKNGLLGAYPLEVYASGQGRSSKVAAIDVIMSDPSSPFVLSSPLVDLRVVDKVNVQVENKDTVGRKDNFYPKVDLSTNSVSIVYHKPGVPTIYLLHPRVTGSAIESLINGVTWAQELGQKGKDCASPTSATPSDFLFGEITQEMCDSMIKKTAAYEPTPKPEPDMNLEGYSKSAEQYLSTINSPVGKVSFTETSSTDPKGDPKNAQDGDIYSLYPPGLLGPITFPIETCHQDALNSPYVAAERPPNWAGSIEDGPLWTGGGEKGFIRMQVLETHQCQDTRIDGEGSIGTEADGTVVAGEGESAPYAYVYHSRGTTEGSGFIGLGKRWNSCTFNTHIEKARIFNWQQEVQQIWEKDYNIVPIEGPPKKLGSYEATPVPQWSDITEYAGHEAGDTWEMDNGYLMGVVCVEAMGFIPMEKGERDVVYTDFPKDGPPLEDPADPLVEYDDSGMIKYKLDPASVPPGINMFLRNGSVYAQYIGIPEISSKIIDVNYSKVNLLGSEYATMTVQDWVGGVKTSRTFQMHLVGNPSNCYTADGQAGLTGKEFAPRVRFNWDWNMITTNTCDSTNDDYIYCDATQFTTELFKKLPLIQDARVNVKDELIPRLTRFYSYLIRDNYSDKFLADYNKYNSTALFNSSNSFLSSLTNVGYDKFITENKLHFRMRDPNGNIIEDTNLPKGGVYSVEIDVNYIDPNVHSMFDGTNLNAEIFVNLTLYREAPNYNPFYETPFDGLVGIENGINVRDGYGAGILPDNTLDLSLAPGLADLGKSNSALVKINYQTENNLSRLNNGIVLDYTNSSKVLKFYPAQPGPVIMNITSPAVGPVEAKYKLNGFDATTSMTKKWTMISSTIGKTKCQDFAGNQEYTFTDQYMDNNLRKLSWPSGRNAGTISLATVFFTPNVLESLNPIYLSSPDNNNLRLYSVEELVNGVSGQAVFLKYYDQQGVNDYTTLKGVFDRISNNQMCVTQSQAENMKVFWNPDYLQSLIEQIPNAQGRDCLN
jgi:hypothetical protein